MSFSHTFPLVFLLFSSALRALLAAECSSSPQVAGFDENELWIVRQRMCGNGECPNTLGSYCYLVQQDLPYASHRHYAGGSKLSNLGGGENSSVSFPYCWDVLSDIITQCWRTEKVAQGAWTYGGQTYTLGMQDTVTRSAIETFITLAGAPTSYTTVNATGLTSTTAAATSTSRSSTTRTPTSSSSPQASTQASTHSLIIRVAVGSALGGAALILASILVILAILKQRAKRRKAKTGGASNQQDPGQLSEMPRIYGGSEGPRMSTLKSGTLETGTGRGRRSCRQIRHRVS